MCNLPYRKQESLDDKVPEGITEGGEIPVDKLEEICDYAGNFGTGQWLYTMGDHALIVEEPTDGVYLVSAIFKDANKKPIDNAIRVDYTKPFENTAQMKTEMGVDY